MEGNNISLLRGDVFFVFFFLYLISLGVLTDDWAFMPGIICFVGSCLEYRAAMVDEEKFLRRRYGKEYEEYCERVGRYFIKINFSARRRVETAGRGKV